MIDAARNEEGRIEGKIMKGRKRQALEQKKVCRGLRKRNNANNAVHTIQEVA